MSVKNVMYVKKIIFGILLLLVYGRYYYYGRFSDCVFKVIESHGKGHTTKKQKLFQQILMKKSNLLNAKFAGLRPVNLFKKKLWHRCFPVNFVKFLRASFLTELLQTTASIFRS